MRRVRDNGTAYIVARLLVVLLSVVLIAGCAGAAPTAPEAQAPAAEAPTAAAAPAEAEPEGPTTITVAFPGDISTIDPHGSPLIVVNVFQNQVFDALVNKNPETLEMEPRLATEWGWEDPTTMAISLREGVVWHDGTPFTADDVKFSLERYRDQASYGGRIQSLDHVEVVDDTHVKLIMEHHHAGLMDALGQAPIVQAGHEDEWYKEHAVGTGPFKLEEWRTGDEIRLVKNEDYWREGEPKADVLVFKVIPELETRIASLLAGDVDLLFDVDLREIDRLRDASDVDVLITDQGDFLYSIYVNSDRPGLDDPRVRRAVWFALDRQAYIDNFQGGLAIPTNSAIGPSHWAYDHELDGEIEYNLDEAAALLEEAGYPNGEGLNFVLLFPSGYADLRAGSEVLQAGLTELGINAELVEMELAAWWNRLALERDYDLGWDIRRNALDDPAVQYGTTGGFQPGPANRTGLEWDDNPDLSEALLEGEEAQDREVRKELYDKVQRIWADGPWIIPVAVKPMSYAYRSDITGIIPQPAAHYQEFRQLDRQ